MVCPGARGSAERQRCWKHQHLCLQDCLLSEGLVQALVLASESHLHQLEWGAILAWVEILVAEVIPVSQELPAL